MNEDKFKEGIRQLSIKAHEDSKEEHRWLVDTMKYVAEYGLWYEVFNNAIAALETDSWKSLKTKILTDMSEWDL